MHIYMPGPQALRAVIGVSVPFHGKAALLAGEILDITLELG
jgi:hypothetical protein